MYSCCRAVWLPAVLLLVACSAQTSTKKPDRTPPPRKKGVLQYARFQFQLEDTDKDSTAPVRTVLDTGIKIRLQKEILFTNRDLESAKMERDEVFGRYHLLLTFVPIAADRLQRVTARNVGKRLAILVNGDIWIAPRIQTRISGGKAAITGVQVQGLLERLARKLKEAKKGEK